MRRFKCVSCGKSIELDWCNNRRGRDVVCPDCGNKMTRDDKAGAGAGARRNQPGAAGAGKGLRGSGFGRGACGGGHGRGYGRRGNCRGVM